MKKINKIKRSDYDRILITETLPHETPLIFSNDGLYDRISSLDDSDQIQKLFIKALVFGEGAPKSVHSTIPYLYKIKKSSTELRRLALLHPRSQWEIRRFYEKYEQLILHYCSISPASIRAPQSVANSFYNKSSWENIHQYKKSGVALATTDKFAKHTPSFFSYRGYDRLYKFFNSRDYFSLEQRFSLLQTLDVSKCFDSIYTHGLSWALKDKAFTKANVNVSTTFAQEFDAVIRHGNHNETNGIPIGPEVSRIFAEVLFQEIDRQTIARLSKFKFNVDYAFRRYVDDVFIFARDERTARRVYDAYADVMVAFNLHANTAKSAKVVRPFLTKKSRLVGEASKATNEFFDKFMESNGTHSLTPKAVFWPWKLTKSYIDSVKALCSHSDAGYDDISSFLIAVITERIKKIVIVNNNEGEITEEQRLSYLNAVRVLLDLIYFFYSVSPSVSASYKLATSVILSSRFFAKHIPEHRDSLCQHIFDLTCRLLHDESNRDATEVADGFIRLEALNVILASRELGENYLLPETLLLKLFVENQRLSYFTIVSCLFYVKSSTKYPKLTDELMNVIGSKLQDLSDVFSNTEKASLLLDMLCCPFVPNQRKKSWARAMHSVLQVPKPNAPALTAFIASCNQHHWQVDWSDVDLLNSLEKKELKQAY